MSHTVALADRADHILSALARQRGQSLEDLHEALATQRAADRHPATEPRYETFEEFLQELGTSSDDIKAAQESAESNADI